GSPQTNSTTPRATTTWWQRGPQEFSVEAWFNTTNTGGGGLIGFGSNNFNGTNPAGRAGFNQNDRVLYMANNGQLRFGVRPDFGTRTTINSSASYNDGQWHHVVATLGEPGMVICVAAVQVAANATGISAQQYYGDGRVGGDRVQSGPSSPHGEGFPASHKEDAVYERARAVEEARANFLVDQDDGQLAPTL